MGAGSPLCAQANLYRGNADKDALFPLLTRYATEEMEIQQGVWGLCRDGRFS
jgi:hypothetical protein